MRDCYNDRKIKKGQSSVWQVGDRYFDQKKKRSSLLSGRCAIVIMTGKKKLQLSVWRVRNRYYDWKIKKFQSSVWRVRDHYYDRKKKVPVVCLAGARSLLGPENKKFQSSVWRVGDHYYDQKKKF